MKIMNMIKKALNPKLNEKIIISKHKKSTDKNSHFQDKKTVI